MSQRSAPETGLPSAKRYAVDIVKEKSIEKYSEEWTFYRQKFANPFINVSWIYKYLDADKVMRKKIVIDEKWFDSLNEYKQTNVLAYMPNNNISVSLDYIVNNPMMQIDSCNDKATSELFPQEQPSHKLPVFDDRSAHAQSFGYRLNQMEQDSLEYLRIFQNGINEMLQAYKILYSKLKYYILFDLLKNSCRVDAVTDIIVELIGCEEMEFKICKDIDDETEYYVNIEKKWIPPSEQWPLLCDLTNCMYLGLTKKYNCTLESLPYASNWRYYKIDKKVAEVTAICCYGEAFPDKENSERLFEPESIQEMYKHEFIRSRSELLKNNCIYTFV
eukprot:75998_1